MGQVLVMYDVRGIQDYIFRTTKVKEAVGASKIIENIFEEALDDAVRVFNAGTEGPALQYDREWYTESVGIKPFINTNIDIQVIYIGGGNASALFASRELAKTITRHMSEFIIRKTYSLQLAASFVEKTDNYSDDFENLRQRMTEVKDSMSVSRPLGTLPVMKMEIQTGYPVIFPTSKHGDELAALAGKSRETYIKNEEGWKIRSRNDKSARVLDNYVTKKEKDSTLAVVHIDGNSMSSRIGELLKGISDYSEAVNRMRLISYNINHAFKSTYLEMENYFNTFSRRNEAFAEKVMPDCFVTGILVAGDDITYVCNGQIAMSTVEYFVRKINSLGMFGNNNAEDLLKYGFTVCAGVAYIHSHFPFSIGYEIAEACCGSAKKEAKRKENRTGDRIGNWIDFHICKNVQSLNLARTREREYVTSQGEELLLRPYYIPVEQDPDVEITHRLASSPESFESFLNILEFVQNPARIPASIAKQLRNTYPLGRYQVELLQSFMQSRGWKMPDEVDGSLYYDSESGRPKASMYDALELMDEYVSIVQGEEVTQA